MNKINEQNTLITSSKNNSNTKGRVGEMYVETLLRNFYPCFTVKNKTRDRGGGDLLLEVDGGIKISIEVKEWTQETWMSNKKACIDNFEESTRNNYINMSIRISILAVIGLNGMNDRNILTPHIKNIKDTNIIQVFVCDLYENPQYLSSAIQIGINNLKSLDEKKLSKEQIDDIYINTNEQINTLEKTCSEMKKIVKSTDDVIMNLRTQNSKLNNEHKRVDRFTIYHDVFVSMKRNGTKKYKPSVDDILAEAGKKGFTNIGKIFTVKEYMEWYDRDYSPVNKSV